MTQLTKLYGDRMSICVTGKSFSFSKLLYCNCIKKIKCFFIAAKHEESSQMESESPSTNDTEAEELKPAESTPIVCLFCEETFPSTENGASNPVLAHLLGVHKFVIAEVKFIDNFPR